MSSTPEPTPYLDPNLDSALRPNLWDEYVGQSHVKANVRIALDAARKRGSTGKDGLQRTEIDEFRTTSRRSDPGINS